MKRLPMMLISVAAMTAMAVPAYADPAPNNDADFLKQLTDAGVTYKDPAQTVAVAKNVCDLAGKGTSATDIKSNLEQRNSFSGNGAESFITLAAAEYCPDTITRSGSVSQIPWERRKLDFVADYLVSSRAHPLGQPEQIVLADSVLQCVGELPQLGCEAAKFFEEP